jgi:hypothetical protein
MQIICSILKKIYAENLLSFSCIGCLTFEFVLVNLTSIVEAYIDFTGGFPSNHLYTAAHEIKLLSGLHRVKSLRLRIDTLQVCIIYHLHYFSIVAFNYVFFSIQTTFFLGITIMNRFFFFSFNSVFHTQDTQHLLPCFCNLTLLNVNWRTPNFSEEKAKIESLKILLENATVLIKIEIFCSESLLADLEMQKYIRNQLELVGLENCVITFR